MKRRQVLLERLKTLCDRFQDPDLPIVPKVLLGFGSFFREKQDPHDVDLVLIATTRDGAREQLEEAVKLHYEVELWNGFLGTTGECYKAYYEDNPSQNSVKLSRWMKHVSWTMLREDSWRYRIDCDLIATRMLQEKLPGLNIVQVRAKADQINLVTNVVHTIWTPDNMDVVQNVQSIWSNLAVDKSTLRREYINFMQQLAGVKKETRWYKRKCRKAIGNGLVISEPESGYRTAEAKTTVKVPVDDLLPMQLELLRAKLKESRLLLEVCKNIHDAIDHAYNYGTDKSLGNVIASTIMNRWKRMFPNEESYIRLVKKTGILS